LARLTGVSTDTLRHYEQRGLLPAVARTASGYRRYPPGTASRVLLIQRALIVGFSLDELTKLLRERDRGGAPCHSVRTLVGERLKDLDRQLHELAALRTDLRALAADWDVRLVRAGAGRPAHLLDTLAGRPAIESALDQRTGTRLRKRPALRRRPKADR
jgi:DNA-binding transcriptional MerR regulator